MKQLKRWLFVTHRWAGVVTAVFMALWFTSGLVIVFAEPPVTQRADVLRHAELLRPEPGWLSAGEAWDRSAAKRRATASPKAGAPVPDSTSDAFVDARLARQAGKPFWLFEDARGQRLAVSALDGELHRTTPEQAVEIAQRWGITEGVVDARFLETLDRSSLARNQEALRPYHRVGLGNGGRELLVSALTGEVVTDSGRLQRGLFWIGNWVHLFRPLESLGLTNDTRVEVLKWTVFVALLASLAGLVVGWLRWKPGFLGKPTYPKGRVHPYREFWLKWHFWAGLVGGVFATAWALSGFVSGNPWQLFSPAAPNRQELLRYAGSQVPEVARAWKPEALAASPAELVEVGWRRVGGAEVLVGSTRNGARVPQSVAGAVTQFDDGTLREAVARAASAKDVAAPVVVAEYDTAYYLRHHRDLADRPLPVLRVDVKDAAETRFYVDPADGRILLRTDRSRQAFRWLYSALHHWDFGWLYRRPLWDGWMVVWVLLGWVLSTSSVVLGWRRLALTARRKTGRLPALSPQPLTAETQRQVDAS